MSLVVAINGSPQMAKGNTAAVLTPFLQGMSEAGCEVETLAAVSRPLVSEDALRDRYNRALADAEGSAGA